MLARFSKSVFDHFKNHFQLFYYFEMYIKEKPKWLIDALNYQIKLSYRLGFQLAKIIVCLVAQFIPTCTK